MKKASRNSTTGTRVESNLVGSFSTRFSLPSFVKRVSKLTVDQRNAISKVGFGNLLNMPNLTLNKSLLVELMERWSSERLAFSLLSRDITINLMDVALIMGLRVVSKPVVVKEDEPFSMLEKEYGAALWKRKITMASLESRLDALSETVNDDFVRSFLLFTFGTFLFPNANGTVDSRYLSILNDLDNLCDYAWGAAVLKDISMWLCKRKEDNVQYVGGCLLFLQIWSYEHIDIARPTVLNYRMKFPRACRWGSTISKQRKWVTSKFKELQENQIIWNLQMTPEESDQNIIKELLEDQNERMELCTPEYSSIHNSALNGSVVRVRSLVVITDSESDSTIAREGDEEGGLLQLRESQDVPEVSIDNFETSTSRYVSAEQEHGHSSTSQDFSTNLMISNGSVVRVRSLVVITDSESDSTIAREGDEEGDLLQLRESQDAPEVSIDNFETSTSHYVSAEQEHEHSSTSQDFSTNLMISNDDDFRTRNRILEEQITELKKEVDELKIENQFLRNQRSLSQLLEERNVELKKEVDDLRQENQHLSLSKYNHVVQLEKILYADDTNATEET